MSLFKTAALLGLAYALSAAPALGHGWFHHSSGHHGCDDGWGYGCDGCGPWARTAPGLQAAPAARRFPPEQNATEPETLETLEGKIAEVIYLPGVDPSAGIVEVRVAAGEETVLARLAPVGFLEQHKISLKEGESISLRGYRVRTGEDDMLVVTEIRAEGRTLMLRRPCGRSVW